MEEKKLHHFQCTVCGYVYETEEDELPDDFVCPVCGSSNVETNHYINDICEWYSNKCLDCGRGWSVEK